MTQSDKKLLACFRDSPSDLVFWSFRYFLGRRTIQACQFAACLAVAWPYLDQSVKKLIERELEEAFRRDDEQRERGESIKELGDDCDRAAWAKVRSSYSAKEA